MENLPRFSTQSLVLEVLERVGCLNFQTQAHLHHLPKCGIVCARGRTPACALSSDSYHAQGVQAAETGHGTEQTPQVFGIRNSRKFRERKGKEMHQGH